MNDTSYLCPITKKSLVATKSGLINAEGRVFPYIGTSSTGNPIPDFVTSGMPAEGEFESRKMYCDPQAAKRYDNYLDWLFETFGQNESELRALMASRLRVKKGGRVLVVGCGLGDDLPAIASMVGETGRIYAQDLSPEMVLEADARLKSGATRVPFSGDIDQIHLSVGNASQLPFDDGAFDAAFHFGGINFFDDPKSAILEMNRVVRAGGRVVIGDEGVAPWLQSTEYGKMMIENIPVWRTPAPLSLLPSTCTEVNLSWVLGNCFYLIDFTVSDAEPRPNIDVVHRGSRGGTIRTRYFGKLEGIHPDLKAKVLQSASNDGVSVQEWLERAVKTQLKGSS